MRLKRWLAMLLAFVMTLTTGLAVGETMAIFSGGSQTIYGTEDEEGNIYIDQFFTWQGELYATDGGSLYRMDAEADKLVRLTGEDSAGMAAGDENGLYAFQGNALYKLTVDGSTYALGDKLADLNEAFALGEDDYVSCSNMLVQDGKVYLLMQGFDPNWQRQQIWEVNLTDGASRKVLDDCIQSMCGYKSGTLLLEYWDMNAAYSGEKMTYPTIETMSTADGSRTVLYNLDSMNLGGLAYDAAADMIYVASDSVLFRYASGAETAERCAYLNVSYMSYQSKGMLLNGRYYTVDNNDNPKGYASCDTDPSKMPSRTLRIAASYKNDVLRAFQKEYPDIPVELVSDTPYTTDELTQNMVSGSAADIYEVNAGYGVFAGLRDKGYCTDLSGSQVIADATARMNQNFVSGFARDGKIWGVPSSCSATALAYSPSVLEKLGLTTDDLPTTWMELLDFIQRWENEFADEFPDLKLFETYSTNLGYLLANSIMSDNMTYYSGLGEGIAFDTPVMRELLGRIAQMKGTLDALSPEEDSNGTVYYSDEGATTLFMLGNSVSPQQYGMFDYTAWPISLSEGGTPSISLHMNLYLLNANCTDTELATTFLEFAATHMDSGTEHTIYPDSNEPVEDEYYAQSQKFFEKSIAELTEELEKADEENKRNIQDMLDDTIASQKYEEENNRWAISAEDIARWREIEQYATVTDYSLFMSTGSTEVSSLLSRFNEGQLAYEQFLKELDRIVRMIRMENN